MSEYYILERSGGEMLLYSLPNPSRREHWLFGKRFESVLQTPVIVNIQEGYERKVPSPFFNTPPVMHKEFYNALLDAGVDNLDVYDAVLRSGDGAVEIGGYKAYNIIGAVSAADMRASQFAAGNNSRVIDAAFESLAINPTQTIGKPMFRLNEYVGAIVVHRTLKEALEAHGFAHLKFTEPARYLS